MSLRDWAYYQQNALGRYAGAIFKSNPNPWITSNQGDLANAYDGGTDIQTLKDFAALG